MNKQPHRNQVLRISNLSEKYDKLCVVTGFGLDETHESFSVRTTDKPLDQTDYSCRNYNYYREHGTDEWIWSDGTPVEVELVKDAPYPTVKGRDEFYTNVLNVLYAKGSWEGSWGKGLTPEQMLKWGAPHDIAEALRNHAAYHKKSDRWCEVAVLVLSNNTTPRFYLFGEQANVETDYLNPALYEFTTLIDHFIDLESLRP